MSLAPLPVPERQTSSQLNLTLNLGSNNPFRNRAISPSGSSPASPGPRLERPRSTNPFLDDTEALSPQSAPGGTITSPMGDKPSFTGNTAELFENLSLDPSKPKERRPAPPRPDKPYPPSQRPKERPDHRERPKDRTREKDPLDIFADPSDGKSRGPPRPRDRRPRARRNSESSVMDKPKTGEAEDDRRRRERRHRDGKSRSKPKPGHRLDVIDKLDVTSIYGTGLFHHDGPFDACNPHRNRKGSRAAPMQAFPKDSKNMALGGAGPNNPEMNLALFHGQMTEGYQDYATGGRLKDPASFNASARIEPIHGAESMGLGTSTFLEGTPASRAAIQRRQSENEAPLSLNGGLQRKKSLAQKIRGINRPGTGRVMSPEPVQTSPSSALSTGSQRGPEKNPFFQDYDQAYESKGAKIEEAQLAGRARASSSPRRVGGLERRITNDRPSGEENKAGGGFMNRMKSLRRTRPEKRVPSE